MENIDRFNNIVYSSFMGSKNLLFMFTLAAISALVISCGSGPSSQGSGGENRGSRNDTFDPRRVSQAHYNSTVEEVQQFIETLNQIIRSRNFEAWKASLSPEYFNEISSPENLRRISQQPAMRSRQIVLRTAEDYFLHVVVPSRQNDDAIPFRVDDIEFVSRNRVKAFTITQNRAGEEVRLRLYDLEKIGNSWTIIN